MTETMSRTTNSDDGVPTVSPSDNGADVIAALRTRMPLDVRPGAVTRHLTTEQVQLVAAMSGAEPAVLAGEGVEFRTFWWGFHVEISHAALEQIVSSGDVVAEFLRLAGVVVPDPARGWVELIGRFLAGSLDLLQRLDEGCGIYISMLWVAPGVFVPTTRPCAGQVRVHPDSTNGLAPVVGPVASEDYLVARRGDTETSLVIETGQRVVIAGSGTIWSGVIFVPRNGPGGWLDWEAGVDAPLPGAHPFSLIGRINGRSFYVGTGTEFIHRGAPGKLYLRVNDYENRGDGAFHAQVDVYSA